MMEEQKVAAFPFPIKGRIPNFKGASKAAAFAMEIPCLKKAKRIKVNPDSPQRALRKEALIRGMTVYMPSPRLRSGFLKLDPAVIDPADIARAATAKGAAELGETINVSELPQMDVVVTGSVAVNLEGKRCGKGHGYGDIEYGILGDLGHEAVPIITTVHSLQVVGSFPSEDHDISLNYVVTPEEVFHCSDSLSKINGVRWDLVTEKDLEEMPVLRTLKSMQKT